MVLPVIHVCLAQLSRFRFNLVQNLKARSQYAADLVRKFQNDNCHHHRHHHYHRLLRR